jgi:hypothetical protein
MTTPHADPFIGTHAPRRVSAPPSSRFMAASLGGSEVTVRCRVPTSGGSGGGSRGRLLGAFGPSAATR